jgi:5-methylcytosine-specific restriction endonuclease McrA/predicted transcriptional regulator
VNDLPDPGTPAFAELIPNKVTRRQMEELLKEPDGLTLPELQERIPEFAAQTHFSRRLRDGDKVFVMERLREGHGVRYRITGLREKAAEVARISPRVRARVLFRDGSRCQMCGASPAKDAEVQLEVDHKIPLHLGGTNDEDNLWTLCRPCNQGKRAFFATMDEHADKLQHALGHDEVHRRIGETLRAFGPGVEIPSNVLEVAASSKQYQEDWHRRLRELRDLGWDYKVDKRKQGNRIASFYTLTKDGGWPATGTIREALRKAAG